ncbi:MAG: DM13 domain-containing protein [Actinomycetota bacterium]|nr:DM13 domain-containing protein [Actinomycetota bacterium]
MTLSLSPPPRTGRAQAGSSCASSGKSTFSHTGPTRLTVGAPGRWRAVVEQQLDIPLREPALAAMRSAGARTLARGRFDPVESPGDGRASLYRLPNDRLALRLEDLRTAAYPDLFVWVSEARDPTTSAQAVAAPHVELGPLKSTRGDQNYLLPKGLDRHAVASVVIWRAPTRMAYTAAALE